MVKRFLFGMLLLTFLSISLIAALPADKNAEVVTAVIKNSQIEVTFQIPDGLYQDLDEDYFLWMWMKLTVFFFNPLFIPKRN